MHLEVKCDRHVGEAHSPRCNACDNLTGEYRQLGLLDADPRPVPWPRQTRKGRSNE